MRTFNGNFDFIQAQQPYYFIIVPTDGVSHVSFEQSNKLLTTSSFAHCIKLHTDGVWDSYFIFDTLITTWPNYIQFEINVAV